MVAQKPLKNPPLVEAIFEIRYDPVDNLADVAARLGSVLNDYPEFEDLNVPPIPKEVPEASGIVRYRYRSSDRSRLYQVGTGVLSVNILKYSDFSDFRKTIKEVLDQHQKIVPAQYIKRLGLRYINKIQLREKSPNDVLNLGCSVPEGFPDSLGWNSQFIFLSEGKQLKVQTAYSKDTQEVLLDLDCFSGGLFAYNKDQLMGWTDSAHQQVEGLFIKSLAPSYLADIS